MESFGKVCSGLILHEARPGAGQRMRLRYATPQALAASSASPEGGVSTPPKTAAKSRSPRRTPGRTNAEKTALRVPHPCADAVASSAVSADIAGGAIAGGENLGKALPWAVCEAVTLAIWSSAKEAVAETPRDGPIFPAVSLSHPSQPSQLSTPSSQTAETKDDAGRVVDHSAVQAHAALSSAWERLGRRQEEIPSDAYRIVRKMQHAAQAYWREASLDLSKAAGNVARFLELQRQLYWRRPTWRGVNLGGWLLLEPGPSSEMFEKYGPAGCEWDLMLRMRSQLGAAETQRAVTSHRERYITEEDFRCIRALGLNAVRIPFGYWVAVGPAEGDPYVGAGLEHLDRALAWCQAYGLQAVLDLHGAPGGESDGKPCGRERKDWRWQEWRFDESVAALRVVAARYRGHPAVSGISVCNEPSETVPAMVLCQFYDRAVRAIREEGMAPDEVAIILPVYRTERLDEIWRLWSREFDGFVRHANTAFDLHLYHCFGTWWQRQGLANQIRMTKRHKKILRRVPAVIGEWSLALAPEARGDGPIEEDQALRAFAQAQLDAYSQASHGWFFWTWRDSPLQQPGWDLRKCLTRSWLTKMELMDICPTAKNRAECGSSNQ